MTTLEKIANKHDDWVRIVKSFGCKNEYCEDIVQTMYLKMHTLINRGIDISYEDDINHFYIYRMLRSLFIDLCIEGKMKELHTVLDKVYWYDRKVFDLISDGMSIAELSKKTNISYYSLYNTYKNVKTLIKDNIEW